MGWAPGTTPCTLTRRQLLASGLAAAATIATRPILAFARGDPLRAPAGTLDRFVAERMTAGRLPGLTAAVVRAGEVVWSRGYGWANLWRDQPVERDTLFMCASVSKTVVCTAVLQAVEAGLFGLDDDVNDVLPFPVRVPDHQDQPITTRQLLTHTSGIRDRWPVWDDLYFQGDSPISLSDFLRGYFVPGGEDYRRKNFFEFAPGADYRYSNVGASLAAYLVEAATGAGFDRWCADRIFQPLGMTRAGWRLADVPAGDVAMPYRWSIPRERFVAYGQYGYPDYPTGPSAPRRRS